MNVYMSTHIRQMLSKDFLDNEKWTDDTKSNHTFLIFANDKKEANKYAESALKKRNEFSAKNERYIMATEPRLIHVVNVTHDINTGTSVTGIWD